MKILLRLLAILAFLATSLPSIPAQPAATGALEAYVEGLDAMGAARWKDAVAAFDRAVQGDSENPSYYTARGVAKTLAEDFPAAQKDLDRSLRLRPNDRETRMWRAVSERLSDWYAQTDTGILYGDDCPREYAIFIHDDLVISYHKPGVDAGTNERSREKFPRAGAWFASLAMGRTNVTPILFTRARKQVDSGLYSEALATTGRILNLFPEDNDALRLEGFARLGYGDAATARTSFTRVLTALTTDGDAYAGRAIAHARLGNLKGADADLALAKKNGSKRTAEAEKAIADARATASKQSRAEAVTAFRAAITAGAGWDELVAKALVVRQLMEGERRRWDERYQDRLRELETALRDKPGNADRTVDLAEYLFDNSFVRGEQVEPRSGWRGYRYQTDQSKEREITRAETLVNEVLDKSPNHLRALGLKVRIRLYYKQNADADQFYKRMLALEAKDPNSLVVYAEMMDAMAWQKAGEAASLRAQDGSVTYSGDWMITHYLTEEGWRQVRANEALASEFAGLATRTLEQAAKALKGTPRGDYYQAKLYLRDGNAAAARDSLQNAIKADPEYVQAYDLLSSTLARLGDEKGSFQTRLRAWGRVETSAGPALTGARPLIVATRFQSARDLLEDALATDPADARVYSYIAVSHAEDEKHEDGLKWFRGALAMEEARARQQGTSYKEGGKDARNISDFGLSMAIRQRMIGILRATGRPPAERLELARASTGVDQRIPISDWTTPVYTSMIPSMDEEPNGLPPQVPEAVEMLAWARIEAGRALHDMGDYKAAANEYQAVYTYQKQYREYVVDRAENLAFVDATRWASLGLGYTNLKLDNYDGAVACLQQIPSRMRAQTPLEKAGVELAAAVKEYKDAHGILTEVEKQEKELDEMNAANRKMVEDELRRREERNKQYDEQRRQQMEDMRRRNQEVDEQRKKQMEDMRRRRQR